MKLKQKTVNLDHQINHQYWLKIRQKPQRNGFWGVFFIFTKHLQTQKVKRSYLQTTHKAILQTGITEQINRNTLKKILSNQPPKLALNEDYYLNEQGYMVFTERHHLKRGYCCKFGCKHCPYRKKQV